MHPVVVLVLHVYVKRKQREKIQTFYFYTHTKPILKSTTQISDVTRISIYYNKSSNEAKKL